MKRILVWGLLVGQLCSAQRADRKNSVPGQVWNLTEVMYHDVVNPPAAARFYAYSILAGYEIMSLLDDRVPKFQRGFRHYPVFAGKIDRARIDRELSVEYGILEAGRLIIPSGYLLEEKQVLLLNEFRERNYSAELIDSSVSFARKIAQLIAQYSRTDGYFRLSTLARYTPIMNDSSWRPTAPEYMPAVEPHWRTIRTFFLDSAQQFRPVLAIPFDQDKNSAWYKQAREVCEKGDHLTDEEKLIANYWDCNPFAVQFQGHMSIGLKKISPGGHWMSITGIVSENAKLGLENSILLHTLVALSLHDAFVSCWDEKYRSNRVRPETAINKYLNERWKPLLQTPPFPEYPSGHSVISTTSAEILTHFLGDGVSFLDTTETYIGMPSRQFSSFRSAAAEARISRLYGGIHFRDAIENGGEQGRLIGQYIIGKLGLNSF